MDKTIKIDPKGVKLIAHRGLSGMERENTCAAFIAAGNRDCYFGIESDVRRTKDGHYIMLHDKETGRVCTENLIVGDTSVCELWPLLLTDLDGSVNRSDLRIPSLQEYIKLCKRYGKYGILEMKDPDMSREALLEIISIIRREDYLDHIIFIDFCLNNLIHLRELLPNQPAQWLRQDWRESYLGSLQKYRVDLDIAYEMLSKEILDAVHCAGLKVNVWTCDDVFEAERLIRLDVDYITTNRLKA